MAAPGRTRSSLTPITTVMSSPLAGAEMMTFLAPASMCCPRLGGVGEDAGRLDDDVGTEVAPRQLGRIIFADTGIGVPSMMTASSSASTSAFEAAEHAVVLQQVRRASWCR